MTITKESAPFTTPDEPPHDGTGRHAAPDQGGEDPKRISLGDVGTQLGVGATMIVGVFAALGVSGNLLARMVRHQPGESRDALIAAIVAVVLFAVATTVPRLRKGWFVLVPIVALATSLIYAASIAARSQGTRDLPAISLSLARPQPGGGLEVTAKAGGSSVRPYERLLLRVAAINRTAAGSGELREATDAECRRLEMHPYDASAARVLSWTESGPDSSGDIATEQSVPVPPDARYVCAWVVIAPRFDRTEILQPETPQNIAVIDVSGPAPSAAPSAAG